MWRRRTMTREGPELLSPAGDRERLMMALHYGANAVYLAGRAYGMRAASASFSDEALREAAALAHGKGAKVYVACNTLPREGELAALPEYLSFLQETGADGLIAADMGVISLAKRYAPRLPLHISTQFGVTNSAAANALFDLGADTVVLARELLLPGERPIAFTVEEMTDGEGVPIEDTRRAMMEIRLRLPRYAPPLSLLRKRR